MKLVEKSLIEKFKKGRKIKKGMSVKIKVKQTLQVTIV
jgi:hypothetical protein